MDNVFSYLRQFNFVSMVFRLILAMSVGGFVGMERERRGRPAGFRTYMLAALGAAMTMILSQYLNFMLCNDWAAVAAEVGVKTDVSRFGAQVINGIGFLGAGTIIVTGHQEVKGLTTAAGLWASACIGLAVGAGFYECVICAFIIIMVCMRALPAIEDYATRYSRNLNIYAEMDSIEVLGNLIATAKAMTISVYDVEIRKESHDDMQQVNAILNLRIGVKREHLEAIAMLSRVDGIISIEEI